MFSKMDVNLSNIFWGFLGFTVLRQAWLKATVDADDMIEHPTEMTDVDPTSMGYPVYTPVGPYAVKKSY